MDIRASLSGEGWGARFSASTDFKSVESTTKNASTFFTHSEVSCCAYTASVQRYNPPNFTENFLNAIDALPKDYEKSIYREFVNTFGTHYIKEANMGALYGQQSSISTESWAKMVQQGIDIDASAGYSGKHKFV